MTEQENKISEQTVVPLGFLLLLIGTFAGGIFWLSDIHSTAAQARDSIVDIKRDREAKDTQFHEEMRDISSRLGRMEGILEELKRRQ